MIGPVIAALIIAAPATAPSASVLVIGDSLTQAGMVVDRVSRRLPWVEWLGPKTGDWGAKHCGYGGYSARSYVDVETVPFRPAATFDMGPSIASWGCPDVAVISLGINYLFLSTDATELAARAAAEIVDTDAMITELRAECGASTAVVITSPGESNASTAEWEDTYDPPYDDRSRWEGYRATIVSSYASEYDGRTGEDIYYMEYVLQGTGDYISGDAIHPDAIGYERMANQLAATLCTVAGGCP